MNIFMNIYKPPREDYLLLLREEGLLCLVELHDVGQLLRAGDLALAAAISPL